MNRNDLEVASKLKKQIKEKFPDLENKVYQTFDYLSEKIIIRTGIILTSTIKNLQDIETKTDIVEIFLSPDVLKDIRTKHTIRRMRFFQDSMFIVIDKTEIPNTRVNNNAASN